jgi:hypothetical protein
MPAKPASPLPLMAGETLIKTVSVTSHSARLASQRLGITARRGVPALLGGALGELFAHGLGLRPRGTGTLHITTRRVVLLCRIAGIFKGKAYQQIDLPLETVEQLRIRCGKMWDSLDHWLATSALVAMFSIPPLLILLLLSTLGMSAFIPLVGFLVCAVVAYALLIWPFHAGGTLFTGPIQLTIAAKSQVAQPATAKVKRRGAEARIVEPNDPTYYFFDSSGSILTVLLDRGDFGFARNVGATIQRLREGVVGDPTKPARADGLVVSLTHGERILGRVPLQRVHPLARVNYSSSLVVTNRRVILQSPGDLRPDGDLQVFLSYETPIENIAYTWHEVGGKAARVQLGILSDFQSHAASEKRAFWRQVSADHWLTTDGGALNLGTMLTGVRSNSDLNTVDSGDPTFPGRTIVGESIVRVFELGRTTRLWVTSLRVVGIHHAGGQAKVLHVPIVRGLRVNAHGQFLLISGEGASFGRWELESGGGAVMDRPIGRAGYLATLIFGTRLLPPALPVAGQTAAAVASEVNRVLSALESGVACSAHAPAAGPLNDDALDRTSSSALASPSGDASEEEVAKLPDEFGGGASTITALAAPDERSEASPAEEHPSDSDTVVWAAPAYLGRGAQQTGRLEVCAGHLRLTDDGGMPVWECAIADLVQLVRFGNNQWQDAVLVTRNLRVRPLANVAAGPLLDFTGRYPVIRVTSDVAKKLLCSAIAIQQGVPSPGVGSRDTEADVLLSPSESLVRQYRLSDGCQLSVTTRRLLFRRVGLDGLTVLWECALGDIQAIQQQTLSLRLYGIRPLPLLLTALLTILLWRANWTIGILVLLVYGWCIFFHLRKRTAWLGAPSIQIGTASRGADVAEALVITSATISSHGSSVATSGPDRLWLGPPMPVPLDPDFWQAALTIPAQGPHGGSLWVELGALIADLKARGDLAIADWVKLPLTADDESAPGPMMAMASDERCIFEGLLPTPNNPFPDWSTSIQGRLIASDRRFISWLQLNSLCWKSQLIWHRFDMDKIKVVAVHATDVLRREPLNLRQRRSWISANDALLSAFGRWLGRIYKGTPLKDVPAMAVLPDVSEPERVSPWRPVRFGAFLSPQLTRLVPQLLPIKPKSGYAMVAEIDVALADQKQGAPVG